MLTRLQSFKLSLIKRFGTFRISKGRWYRYSWSTKVIRRHNQLQKDGLFELALFGDLSDMVAVDIHSIVISRTLRGLFRPTPNTVLFPDDTRIWIECTKTNLFRPGMDFTEVTDGIRDTIRLTIYESESLLDLPLECYEGLDVNCVSFSDPKEAMVFKLSHC